MVARTLGQQALPTTFGLRAAGWLDALLDARDELATVPFAAQLGGAAGTMASLGDRGPRVLELLASGLDLDEPSLPWHTARGRIGRLARRAGHHGRHPGEDRRRRRGPGAQRGRRGRPRVPKAR